MVVKINKNEFIEIRNITLEKAQCLEIIFIFELDTLS